MFVALLMLPVLFSGWSAAAAEPSAGDSNTQVAVLLDYDTTSSASVSDLHGALEGALSWLKDEGFPMSKVLVVTWRNTLDDQADLTWLMDTLAKYGVSSGREQFGLYVAPEDTNRSSVLDASMRSFHDDLGRYPYFVAGSSAGSSTYTQLVEYGVKLSFFNLWEEGEDFTYRGYSTHDGLPGANWEGSPFQPYKPSKYSANAPGQSAVDELDIWEAHWITRNPSYAYMAVNSRNWGSIHPHDLLLKNVNGTENCSPDQAIQKLNTILDLVDYNAAYNPLLTLSYPVEISYLLNSDNLEVWQRTIQEFTTRNYTFTNAVELRDALESLEPETPHTPVCIWYDNLTDSDLVVKGENTPFAMVSSPYGRFIYARRDALNDSGAPMLSVVSYTTARAYNESFQSIRELTGVDAFKMNTYVNGEPIDMRWRGDIQSVHITPGKAIAIQWAYLKDNVPYIAYNVTTYLTSYGVLIEKDLTFKETVNASVTILHHFNVQDNSPFPLTDADVRLETDQADAFRFFPANAESKEIPLKVNSSIAFIAKDGYTAGITLISGKPDSVRAFDEAAASPFETLEFDYLPHEYLKGDSLRISYALSPARNLQNADQLAISIKEVAQMDGSILAPEQIPEFNSPSFMVILAALLVATTTAVYLAFFWSRRGLKKS